MSGAGIAVRELWRQPARFVPVIAALTLLTVLSVMFGALLDGLSLGATGALRTLPVDLVVLADEAQSQIDRSRVSSELIDDIAAIIGVEQVGVLGHARLSARLPSGDTELVSVLAADQRPAGVPADLGDGAAVDTALWARGMGSSAAVTFDDVAVAVTDRAGDVGLGLNGTVWVDPERWRQIVSQARPDLVPPVQFITAPELEKVPESWPALTVRVADGADVSTVAQAIDQRSGTTQTVTRDALVAAIPGVERERRVFTGLITLTVLAACVVVALFLGLLTVERLPLLAALRAVGLRGGGLAAGLMVQAVAVVVAALTCAALATAVAVPLLPATVPVLVLPGRAGATAVGLLVAAVLGALGSLRRVLRADPAAVMS